jgi:hypothetical protein
MKFEANTAPATPNNVICLADRRVRVRTRDADAELTADVQAGGLRLRYPSTVPLGRFLWLDIDLSDGNEPVHALGEVLPQDALALALDIKFKHLFPDQRRRLLHALGQ